jgi:thioesterase domain-containing protein/acyl carrier protein
LSGAELGAILRSFGQFHSAERLLPKYAYASPGSLYATQLHLEITGRADLRPGFYYYHPRRHQLVLIAGSARREPGIRVHLAGKRRAIEPVYRNNIREVLEIEAGHLAGLFEEILPEHGLTLRAGTYDPDVLGVLGCAADDYYLGSFDVTAYAPPEPDDDTFDIYVQAHPGGVTDLPSAQYLYRDGTLEPVSDELVLKKHVIAINQQVYERARFGVTVVARGAEPWRHYVDLGRRLQRLQLNRLGLGFMSSGYSSKSGNDLRSAQRITSILRACDRPTGPSYFFVGGRVSPAQVAAEGMGEDVVHMRGPAEIIRDDLTAFLPDYMVPNRVVVVDAMPLTANGKVDQKALVALDRAQPRSAARPFTAPRTATEKRVARIWRKVMRQETVSVNDDFFEIGGNSLLAVRLVNAVNREFDDTQPMQMIFESPTVETIAERLDDRYAGALSRLVPLSGPDSDGDPVFFWPGLGGYPMNLRTLARECRLDRPVHGVQSYGINAGETPYDTVAAMAAADVRTIRHAQASGPYTLWGYSFGARVAFETAHQLERAGEEVERLFLIAPGSPLLPGIDGPPAPEIEGTFADPEFVTLLFSVFTGGITDPVLHECRATATDEASFVAFLRDRFGGPDVELMRRVITVVRRTYRARLSPPDLGGHRLRAPVTVFRATGDDRSFLERDPSATARPPAFADLAADHYGLLKPPAVAELAAALNDRLPS